MRKSKSFGELLYRSFQETYGPVVSIVSIVLGVLSYYVVPANDTIAVRHVLVIGILALYAFFILVHAAYRAHKEEGAILPEVLYGSGPPKGYEPAVALLLLAPSELFSHDSAVATYLQNNGIEQLIGLGRVINVQENGNIQVLVTHSLQYSEEWEEVKSNNAAKLKKLLVKPTVPGFAMEAIVNG